MWATLTWNMLCRFPRVQETDGSYFESFTALSWKQENRRLGALRTGEARAEQPPPCEAALGIMRKSSEMTSHEKEALYIEVIFVVIYIFISFFVLFGVVESV